MQAHEVSVCLTCISYSDIAYRRRLPEPTGTELPVSSGRFPVENTSIRPLLGNRH